MQDRQHDMVQLLQTALLEKGPLSRALYENALEDNIERWHVSRQISGETFIFVVAEARGEVAIALLEAERRLYINEAARDKLADLWSGTYDTQLGYLIPLIAEDLADGALSVTGVQHVS